eukprot:TRINITY_DN2202_c0_g2_i1.p1 TRINITY_DN2202_c0_g2~~TRINITY_DN2202_c0_g2_i1.p1  ORF type:complete len:863 (+),score=136.00 TRINITY_DN2202_c0_g2_i1:101-2689(+)
MGNGCTRRAAAEAVEPFQPVVAAGDATQVARQSRQNSASSSSALSRPSSAPSTRTCSNVKVARLRQQRNAADEISSLLEVIDVPASGGSAMTVTELQLAIEACWGVPPGMQLLSCIDEQMHQGQLEHAPENRLRHVHLLEPEVRNTSGAKQGDRCIGEFGFPSENLWLHLTDFRKLRPPQATEPFCQIPDPERRGVTIAQVKRLTRYVQEYTGPGDVLIFWCDRHLGRALHSRDLNFYTLYDWVIGPSTYRTQCSFAELLAVNAEEQLPRWFATHWWGLKLLDFAQCLKDHCSVRCLPDSCSYWVGAACQNQLQLQQELADNLWDTGTFKVLQVCDGMLFIVDSQGTAFTRSWCCFEGYLALQPDRKRDDPLLFDIAAVCNNPRLGLTPNSMSVTEISTDGLTEAELELEEAGSSGWSAKAKREAYFPLHVIGQALAMDIRNSHASRPQDQIRIFNHICQRPVEDLDKTPVHDHAFLDSCNDRLRSAFALAGWRQCVDQKSLDRTHLSTATLTQAVRMDTTRAHLQLGFAHCGAAFDNARLNEVGRAMPESLRTVGLVIDGCLVDCAGISEFLDKVPQRVETLALGLARARLTNEDIGTLSDLLPKELLHFELGLAGTNISELKCLKFPAGLLALDLNLSNIPLLATTALCSMAMPAQLQLLHLQLRRTRVFVQDLAQFCKALPAGMQVLDFKLDGAGLTDFSSLSLPSNLASLNMSLGGNNEFTDLGLITLAKVLPQSLVQLSINIRSTSVGDEGIAELSELLPNGLEEIAMTVGGTAVSEVGLRSLAAVVGVLPALETLTVDCSNGHQNRRSTAGRCQNVTPGCAEQTEEEFDLEISCHSIQARGREQISSWRQALLAHA